MSAAITPAELALSAVPGGALRVLSYNVLMPNSGDGWWVFKYYDGDVPEAVRAWPWRRRLLSEQLLGADAGLICLQEARPDTFASDFAFLTEAGYAGLLHGKSMLRPATFWRDADWEHLQTRETDKVLGLILRARAAPQRVLGLLNGHLTAAPDPRRRFRQVFDALDRMRKDLQALGVAPERAALVFCGDFNARPEGSATQALLSGEAVGPDFREPGHPSVSVSSKARRHGFAPMQDAYLEALGAAPVTLWGSRVAGLMEGEVPSERLLAALEAMFERFAVNGRMDRAAIEAWIQVINRAPARGSEHRKAIAALERSGAEALSLADFLGVYRSELSEGKIWSVQHDLQACGLLPEGPREPATASLDRVCYTRGPLELVAVRDPLTPARRAELESTGLGLPNAWHPSDHLPLGVVLRWG
ncbi:MAG: endonuclease/exonuclease/phosphatase family protein [Alphaproteobacteria bacterium]|nr:endonuclease/exonuclease/phosphatase family protein [Alphaproteobacteria bacterium]